MIISKARLALACAGLGVILTACGGGSSSNGGGSGSDFISWSENIDGAVVQDANGNAYQFDSSSGCMFSSNTNNGPSGFCLAATASGHASYGPTNCSNPSSNSLCNTASFEVVLTKDPGSAGCIAVLTAGDSSSVTAEPLAVTSTGSGFNIQSGKTATAFGTYWNGFVPICGGSSPYKGSYTLNVTGPTLAPGSGCVTDVLAAGTYTIDSGGVIDDEKGDATGVIAADGSASLQVTFVDATFGGGGLVSVTYNGVKKNSDGKWVLSGTNFPFCLGFDANPWTLTQN